MMKPTTVQERNLYATWRTWLVLAMLVLAMGCALPLLPDVLWQIFQEIDNQLLLACNYDGGFVIDQFWFAFSSFRTWIPLMIVLGLELFLACDGSWRKRLLFLVCLVLMLTLLDQLSSGVIKHFVARPRPSHDPAICGLLHYVNGYHGGRYGFVSGHATNIAGLATWLCLIFRRPLTRLAFGVFAVMLCYSRMYLGVHYPSDILCGALLGFTIAYLLFRLMRRWFTFSTDGRTPLLNTTMVITVIVIMAHSAFMMLGLGL